MVLLRILLFLAGLFIIFQVLLSAILTFVLPRGVTDGLARRVFLTLRTVIEIVERFLHTYEARDKLWALYAPIALLLLPLVWIVSVAVGYTAMFIAVGVDQPRAAFTDSGSSLLTLGFAPLHGLRQTLLAFSEAVIGLGLIALLIAYLPTIYSAWARREGLVTMLEVRAGTPPTPLELFRRYHQLGRMDHLNELWNQWEVWFADIEESHRSLAALALFRSTQPDRSWVTAAGCVLDAAALSYSMIDLPNDPQAALVIRGGTLTFRKLCDLFRLPYDPDPRFPAEPISVTRAEWDGVYDQLAALGLPLVADREQAWRDFAGWRVNYVRTLRLLAGLTIAPTAPWSGDRAIRYHS